MQHTSYRPKHWRVDWSDPELDHRKYSKAYREDDDYSEDVVLYFGDLHTHTNLSPCANVHPYNPSPEESYEYAREVARSDFLAIADHAEKLTEDQWAESMRIAREHNAPGEFVAWPAVEWATPLHGHRNIYYDRYGVPLISGQTHATPRRLWEALRQLEARALTVPHHSARELLADLTCTDDELEPAFEIYSNWGNEEYFGAPLQDTERSFTRGFANILSDPLRRGVNDVCPHRVPYVDGDLYFCEILTFDSVHVEITNSAAAGGEGSETRLGYFRYFDAILLDKIDDSALSVIVKKLTFDDGFRRPCRKTSGQCHYTCRVCRRGDYRRFLGCHGNKTLGTIDEKALGDSDGNGEKSHGCFHHGVGEG